MVAGARGASVAVFDAAALETLDTARPGLGLELALAAARAGASATAPSPDATGENAFVADDDDAPRHGEWVSSDAFLPEPPEAEVCFAPPLARARGSDAAAFATHDSEKMTRESNVLTSERLASVRASRKTPRNRVARALRAAFAAAGAEETPFSSQKPCPRDLRVLAGSCATLRFDVGQQIFRPGDRAAFAGVLVSGAASVVDREGRVSATLGAGAVLGERGAFFSARWLRVAATP